MQGCSYAVLSIPAGARATLGLVCLYEREEVVVTSAANVLPIVVAYFCVRTHTLFRTVVSRPTPYPHQGGVYQPNHSYTCFGNMEPSIWIVGNLRAV